jgi:uncharacterized membrane protein YfcA
MNIIEVLLVFAVGFAVSVPSSLVGLGGGFIIVPVLILVFQLPVNNAVAISLVAILGTTVSSTFGYIRQKRVDFKLGLLYDILDVPGIVIGAYLTTVLPVNVLVVLCGFFIVAISILVIKQRKKHCSTEGPAANGSAAKRKSRKIDSEGKAFRYTLRSTPLALTSSLLGGLVTGLSGLGGGITDVSTMMLLGIPAHIAVASSEFAMAITNGFGVLAHGFLNNILVEYALPLTLGTIVGAQVGCLIAKRVEGKTIRGILSIIALIAGIRLILSAFAN